MGVIFAILWGVIKWVFLILFAVLFLLLLIVLVFIFTPVRYQLKGEKNSEVLQGRIKVTWLLHLISFQLSYENGELIWEGKIGPKVIAASYPIPKKVKKTKKPKPAPKAQKQEEAPVQEPASVTEMRAPSEVPPQPRTIPAEEMQEQPPALPEKKTWRQRLTAFCQKVRRFFERLLHPFKSMYHKLRKLYARWSELKERWDRYPQKAETVRAVKELAIGLLRPLAPKAYEIDLLFGFEDPATTGKVLGYYYMLDPLLFPARRRRREISVEADFKRPVLEFKGWCRGHFCAGSFLRPVIRALMNAHIRRLIRYIRTYQS